MNLRRVAIIGILLLILALLVGELIAQYKEHARLKAEAEGLREKVSGLDRENEQNERNLEYVAVPENLEKDLRERFNYKKPDEKMIIIIPEAERQ
jgi:cell division protein FtsB